MDFQTLASNLANISGSVFVKCPVMDFTRKEPALLTILTKDREFDVILEREHLARVVDFLKVMVFKPKVTVVCWNIKALYSYTLFHTGRDLSFSDPEMWRIDGIPIPNEPVLLDLEVVEHYNGINKRPPKTYADAMKRLKAVYPLEFLDIYKKLHLPLIKDVIPHLETTGIVYRKDRVHAHYEIEGQENGRLKCSGQFKKSYNPHTIKPDEKPYLKTPELGSVFLYFDYKALEVRILQWLSGDKNLGRMLESGDTYLNIFKEITGKDEINDQCRKFTKGLVLPVMFGAGARGISKRLEIKEETASRLINKLHEVFGEAFSYLKSAQDGAGDGLITDYFGRCREITAEDAYKARNFCIQSPAATICLYKLVCLHKVLKSYDMIKIGFSVHDGYAIFSERQDIKRVIPLSRDVLEAEDDLFPGLELHVSIEAGTRLNNLREVKRRVNE